MCVSVCVDWQLLVRMGCAPAACRCAYSGGGDSADYAGGAGASRRVLSGDVGAPAALLDEPGAPWRMFMTGARIAMCIRVCVLRLALDLSAGSAVRRVRSTRTGSTIFTLVVFFVARSHINVVVGGVGVQGVGCLRTLLTSTSPPPPAGGGLNSTANIFYWDNQYSAQLVSMLEPSTMLRQVLLWTSSVDAASGVPSAWAFWGCAHGDLHSCVRSNAFPNARPRSANHISGFLGVCARGDMYSRMRSYAYPNAVACISECGRMHIRMRAARAWRCAFPCARGRSGARLCAARICIRVLVGLIAKRILEWGPPQVRLHGAARRRELLLRERHDTLRGATRVRGARATAVRFPYGHTTFAYPVWAYDICVSRMGIRHLRIPYGHTTFAYPVWAYDICVSPMRAATCACRATPTCSPRPTSWGPGPTGRTRTRRCTARRRRSRRTGRRTPRALAQLIIDLI